MKIKRYSATFSFLLMILFLGMINMFRLSSEAKINLFTELHGLELPVLIINTDGGKSIKSKEKFVSAEYSLYDKGELIFSGRAKIRGRGNSTWKSVDTKKRSYLFKTKETIDPFGMAEAKKWILMSNVTDKTSLRNIYAYHIASDVFDNAGWAPKTQFVTLVINKKVDGLYGFMEKAEILDGRVELPQDESFLAEVNSRLNRAWNFRTTKGVTMSIREKEGADTEYYRNAEKYIQNFEDVLFSDYFKDPEKGWRAIADEKSFVDWYLVNEYTKNHDARFQDSCFMHYDTATDRLYMGPVWDFDISCGNVSYHGCDKSEGLFIQSRHWFKRLWEDPYFKESVFKRWQEKSPQIKESLIWLEDKADLIEDAANADDMIWRRFGRRQWPHAPGWRNRKTYRDEVKYLTDWCKKRTDWLDAEFTESQVKTSQAASL